MENKARGIKQLKADYEAICMEYIERFCKRQEMDFEGWVGNDVGGIALIDDFFFGFSDIVYDVNTKQSKGLIIDWYNDNVDYPDKAINYYSFTKGLRVSEIK